MTRGSRSRPRRGFPEAGSHEERSGGDADLQCAGAEKPFESWIGREKAGDDGERFRGDRKEHGLKPDENRHRSVQQSVHVERDPEERPAGRDQCGAPENPRSDQYQAGIEEQPARAVEQHEAKVPPAIAPAPKMRRPTAAVG